MRGPVPDTSAATVCLPLRLLGPLRCDDFPSIIGSPFGLLPGLMLSDRALSTPSSSSSVPPYRASRGPSTSEDDAEDMEDLRRMRARRGACEPGSSMRECEEGRRTVVGGDRARRAEAVGCGGEGVVMEAEFEVSGDAMEGRFGAVLSALRIIILQRVNEIETHLVIHHVSQLSDRRSVARPGHLTGS